MRSESQEQVLKRPELTQAWESALEPMEELRAEARFLSCCLIHQTPDAGVSMISCPYPALIPQVVQPEFLARGPVAVMAAVFPMPEFVWAAVEASCFQDWPASPGAADTSAATEYIPSSCFHTRTRSEHSLNPPK